jgi:hypothetical protein
MQCGYNLRGLREDGRCPECGHPITDSTRGDVLRYADRGWLGKLRFGTTLKLVNVLIVLVLIVAVVILRIMGAPPALHAIAVAVGGAFGLWAAFLITAQEPRLEGREDPVSLRRLVRACAIFAFAGNVLQHAAALSDKPSLQSILGIVGVVLAITGIVQTFGELVYYRRFARRIPAPTLVRWTTIIQWGLPICLLLMSAGATVAALTIGVVAGPATAAAKPPTTLPTALLITAPFACIGLIGTIVFSIWWFILLLNYRKEFEAAARGLESVTESRRTTPLGAPIPPPPSGPPPGAPPAPPPESP